MTVERCCVGWTKHVSLVTAGLTLTLGCPAARTDYDYSKYRPEETYAGGVAVEGQAGAAGETGAGLGQGGAEPTVDAGTPDAADASSSSTGGTVAKPDATTMTPDTDAEAGALSTGASSDFDAIQGCLSKACGVSYASISNAADRTISKSQSGCTMTGLRDRTPGLYLHSVVSNDSRGLSDVQHLILITKDGTVLYSVMTDLSGSQSDRTGTTGRTYTDAQSCTLSDASYFDGCLTAVNKAAASVGKDDAAWACLAVDPTAGWLKDCTAAEPSCE